MPDALILLGKRQVENVILDRADGLLAGCHFQVRDGRQCIERGEVCSAIRAALSLR